jgi:hypothetical protein
MRHGTSLVRIHGGELSSLSTHGGCGQVFMINTLGR